VAGNRPLRLGWRREHDAVVRSYSSPHLLLDSVIHFPEIRVAVAAVLRLIAVYGCLRSWEQRPHGS
jgi:hypothetical protein